MSTSDVADDEQSLGGRSTRSHGSLGAILQMVNTERLRISRHRAPRRARRGQQGNRRATAGTTASSKSGSSDGLGPDEDGVEVRRLTENTDIDIDVDGDDSNNEILRGEAGHDSFLDAVNAVQMNYSDDHRSVLTGMTGKSFEKEIVGAYLNDDAAHEGQKEEQEQLPSQRSLQIPKNINIVDGTGSNIDATVIQASQADIDRDTVAFWQNYISTENNQDDEDLSDLDDDDIDGDKQDGADATVSGFKSNGRGDDDNRSVVSSRSISTHGSLGVLLADLADDMSRQSIHKMAKSRNRRGGRRPGNAKEVDDDDDDFGNDNDERKLKPRRGRRRKSEDEGEDDIDVDVQVQEEDEIVPKENLQELIVQVYNEHQHHQKEDSSDRQPSAAVSLSSASTKGSPSTSTDEEMRTVRNRERDAFEKEERKKHQSSAKFELPSDMRIDSEAVLGGEDSGNENAVIAGRTGSAPAIKARPLSAQSSSNNIKRGVSFSSVEIRQYERVLGDHPSSFGPPIAIGWNHHRASTKIIDISDPLSKQSKKIARRHNDRSGPRILARPLREIILLDIGYSQQELANANRAVVKTKRSRQRTYHNSEGLPRALDESIEGAKNAMKKMTRSLSHGSSNDPAKVWLREHKE